MTQPTLGSSFLKAAYGVLSYYGRPLSARSITSIALEDGYLEPSREGRTPWQTMKSKLSVHIRRHADRSIFVRTSPGTFFLRELLESRAAEYRAPPFRAGPPSEQIMVFDQSTLDALGRFQGIRRDWKPYFDGLAIGRACYGMDRMLAETSPGVKQLLTYTLVRRDDGALLCFDRGQINRVEDSLRGRSCVGFGGHVKVTRQRSLFDADEVGLFRSAAAELVEELRMTATEAEALSNNPSEALRLVGVLNDDSSANGLRHIAFVMEYRIGGGSAWARPRGREKSINRVRWLTGDSARHESVHRFEYWSQLCLRAYAEDLAVATPSFRVRRSVPLSRAKVICLVGQMGSGKTEASIRLREQFGFADVSSGGIVAELLGVPPVPTTPRRVFQELAEQFIRQPDGPERLGAALAARSQASVGRVLVDGIRHVETLDALRRHLAPAGVAVVYVHAPFDIAFELYRLREDPEATVDTFVQRRTSPVESEVARMVDLADAALYNWLGLGAYLNIVSELGEQYLSGAR